MFGGWAIYRGGEMIAIVYNGRTYVKAETKAAQARFVAAGTGPSQARPNQTFRSFWEIPPAVILDDEELTGWSPLPQWHRAVTMAMPPSR